MWPPLKTGDIARIKHEDEVVLVLQVWRDCNQADVLRQGKKQYIPFHLLEVISKA